jgi:hypothetical protein
LAALSTAESAGLSSLAEFGRKKTGVSGVVAGGGPMKGRFAQAERPLAKTLTIKIFFITAPKHYRMVSRTGSAAFQYPNMTEPAFPNILKCD